MPGIGDFWTTSGIVGPYRDFSDDPDWKLINKKFQKLRDGMIGASNKEEYSPCINLTGELNKEGWRVCSKQGFCPYTAYAATRKCLNYEDNDKANLPQAGKEASRETDTK